MVIRCSCGGALDIEEQSYADDYAFEGYKCVSCGETGSLTHNGDETRLSGCVERV